MTRIEEDLRAAARSTVAPLQRSLAWHEIERRARRRRARLATSVSAVAAVIAVAGYAVVAQPDRLPATRPSDPALVESATWRLTSRYFEGASGLSAFMARGKVVYVAESDYTASQVKVATYDPAGDSWTEAATSPLAWRAQAAMAFGEKFLFVWGGANSTSEALADGAVWNSSTGTWRMLPPAPVSGRHGAKALWTGREFVVWGGAAIDGAAYDPEANTWRQIARAPLATRDNASTAWVARRMIVWGGCADHDNVQCDEQISGRELTDGAAYDPESDRWTPLPPSPLAGRDRPATAVVGDILLIWGGRTADGSASGAILDVMRNEWRRMSDSPLSPRHDALAASWGGGMLIAGGMAPDEGEYSLTDAALYDLADDAWHPLPRAPRGIVAVGAVASSGTAVYAAPAIRAYGPAPMAFGPRIDRQSQGADLSLPPPNSLALRGWPLRTNAQNHQDLLIEGVRLWAEAHDTTPAGTLVQELAAISLPSGGQALVFQANRLDDEERAFTAVLVQLQGQVAQLQRDEILRSDVVQISGVVRDVGGAEFIYVLAEPQTGIIEYAPDGASFSPPSEVVAGSIAKSWLVFRRPAAATTGEAIRIAECDRCVISYRGRIG